MNVSVLWEKVSRANMEGHEAAGRVAFYLARDTTDPIGHERSNRVKQSLISMHYEMEHSND